MTVRFNTSELRRLVDASSPISVRRQCKLMGLSWSSYFYRQIAAGEDNLYRLFRLRQAIDTLWLEYPFYGVESMRLNINNMGLGPVNHKLIRRLMREMGLMSMAPGPHTSKPHPQHKKWPYLLRGVAIDYSDKVWCTDITYLPMRKGHFFLTAIMDWHSRYVLSWRISNTMDSKFCLDVLEEAVTKYGTPMIMNTDQGAQYTSTEWIDYLLGHQISVSMDGKGRASDNVMIERLWRSYKYEYLYLWYPENGLALEKGTEKWMQYYNTKRLHTSLGNATPIAFYHENRRLIGPLNTNPFSALWGLPGVGI